MKDARLYPEELAALAEWLDMAPDDVWLHVLALPVERRGRRPGGPGGRPRRRK